MKNKKYFFNDFASVKFSESEDVHEKGLKSINMNQRKKEGYFNGSIVMTKDPSILWILEDVAEEKMKTEVVYSSELQEKSR